MVKIKLLDNTELHKKGEIVNYAKSSAENLVSLGVAEYIKEQPKVKKREVKVSKIPPKGNKPPITGGYFELDYNIYGIDDPEAGTKEAFDITAAMCNVLKKKGIAGKRTYHEKGVSPWIRIKFPDEIKSYPEDVVKEYKVRFWKEVYSTTGLPMNKLKQDLKVMAGSFQHLTKIGEKHYKYGTEEKVIDEWDGKEAPLIKEEIDKISATIQSDKNEDEILYESDINDISCEDLGQLFKDYYTEGQRNFLLVALAGRFHKCNISAEDAWNIIKSYITDDKREREAQFKATFSKPRKSVSCKSFIRQYITGYDEDETYALYRKIKLAVPAKTKRDSEEIKAPLSSNKSYVSSPKKGIYILEWKPDDDGKLKFSMKQRIHSAYIKKVRIINNPHRHEELFEVTFGCPGLRDRKLTGNIVDVAESVKNIPGCSNDKMSKEAISCLIGRNIEKFEQLNMPIGDAIGIYWDKDKLVGHKIDDLKLHNTSDLSSLKQGFKALGRYVDLYSKNEDHKQGILQIIGFMILHPFGFARRQRGMIQPIMFILGVTGTAKSLTTYIGQAVSCCYGINGFEHTGSSVSSAYQLSKKYQHSTFPIVIHEAGALLSQISDTKRNSDIVEILKNMAEMVKPIYSKNSGEFIAYSTPIKTANFNLITKSDALRIRSAVWVFGQECSHNETERSEAMQLFIDIEHDLGAIGTYVIHHMNDKLILDSIFERNPAIASQTLFNHLSELVGSKLSITEPKHLGVIDQPDVSDFFENMMGYIKDDIFKRFKSVGSISKDTTLTFRNALDSLRESDNLPSYLSYLPSKNALFIAASLQNKVGVYESGSYERAAIKHKLTYHHKYSLKICGKPTKKNGVLIAYDDFVKLFSSDSEMVEKDEKLC